VLRHDVIALGFVELGLADAPVLTEATAQIATRGAKTKDLAARKEVVQRFLFDRIDGKPRGRAIAEGIELAADVSADVSKPRLAIAKPAKARAERAENLSVGFAMPPKGLSHGKNIPLLLPDGKSRKALQRLHCGDRVL